MLSRIRLPWEDPLREFSISAGEAATGATVRCAGLVGAGKRVKGDDLEMRLVYGMRVTRKWGAMLATAAVVAAVAAGSPGIGSATRTQDPTAVCTPDPGWGTLHQELVPDVLRLVNDHRVAVGLAPLKLSPELTAAAVWKARHMAAFGYLGSADPGPPIQRTFVGRFKACGYTGPVAGELVGQGYGDPGSLKAGWIADPSTRALLENQAFTMTGIGIASDAQGMLYWVEDLGAATGTPPAPEPPRCRVPALVGKTLTAAVRAVRRARCTVGDVSLTVSRARRGRVVRQAPRPGRLLAAGGQVKLVVSIGPRRSS